jgi:hypothetical protein
MQTVDDLDLDIIGANMKHTDLHKREPMESVDFYVVYIDANMAIEKIVCENEPIVKLENGKNGILKDRLLHFIQQKRFINDKKYKLLNFFHFHIPLEPHQLQSFVKNKVIEYPEFMKSPSYLTDIVIEDSLPIFHDMNSVFLFFKAAELRNMSKTAKHKLRIGYAGSGGGILVKDGDSTIGSSRVTKKVRFEPKSD